MTPHESLPLLTIVRNDGYAAPTVAAPFFTQAITVTRNTLVNYCYSVVNSGDLTLGTHSLYDPLFGNLLTDQPISLIPGGAFSLTGTPVPQRDRLVALNGAALAGSRLKGMPAAGADEPAGTSTPAPAAVLPAAPAFAAVWAATGAHRDSAQQTATMILGIKPPPPERFR